MNTDLTFHRSGTGPAGRRAGRVPSLPFPAIHPPRQPAIPDEGRSAEKYMHAVIRFARHYVILAAIVVFTGCASESSLIRSGVKPNDGETYTTPEGGGGMRIGPEVTDPLEKDPRYQKAFKDAAIKAEQELKRRRIEPQLGYCHIYWETKKRILRRDYKIDWKTPAELNPWTSYD